MTDLPDPLPVEPLRGAFDAAITPPGSKSLTCRAYVLAALAHGESRIVRPLRSDDTDHLVRALGTLGAESRWDDEDLTIRGVGGRFPRGGEVNLGDGGAPTRFMIAAACLADEPVVVDGSPRMRERPVAELMTLLRQLGARIEYVNDDERLPVRVTPSAGLSGGRLEVPLTSSSQSVSALLLIGPHLPGGLDLTFVDDVTSASYIDLTVRTLNAWSVKAEHVDVAGACDDVEDTYRPPEIEVRPTHVRGREFRVEPDASSAAYWMVAAALVPGARLELVGMRWPSPQPDLRVIYPLKKAGVGCETLETGIVVRGPSRLSAIDCDARLMPDGALALCALVARAEGRSRITGLRTLRVKETDRIAALAEELRRLGCTVEADDDALSIDPSTSHDRPVVIETYRDHRMAMAFAVLGLARPGISIRDPGCVSKSYPGFWSDLRRLYED